MYHDLILKQRKFFQTNETKSYLFRIFLLERLKDEIKRNINSISEALYNDLGKSSTESYMTEISFVINELIYLIKNLKKLMSPRKVKTPISLFPAKSYVIKEPLGVVLVISPWNYPFLLALNPLIGAISAGNTVILKPSEFSQNTNEVIKRIIGEVFNETMVTIVEGEVFETTELLKQRFDYIFFTGSTNVGRVVMKAASRHLTPLTLELGGKSPVIVYDDFDLRLAAKKIAFGKLINAGQTCIAPDYLIIKESLIDDFTNYYKYYVNEFYGNDPLSNDDYPKIINKKNLDRLVNLIDDDQVLFGSKHSDFKIEPTILLSTVDSKIMSEEIFGPILPIIKMEDISDPIEFINKNEKPLALYVFTKKKEIKDKFINETSSGSLVFNDTVLQFANSNLPFGGVGHSGFGKYHGKLSFNTFSHDKAILDKKNYIDVKVKYQPYTKDKEKLIKKIM